MNSSRTIRRVAAASTVALVTSASVASAAAAGTTTTPVYTHKDSGRTIHLKVGTIFKVKLKTCFDCGDSWHWKHRPDHHIVKLLRKHQVAPNLQPGETGGIGRTIYKFKVVGRGATRLVLVEDNPSGNVISHFRLRQSWPTSY